MEPHEDLLWGLARAADVPGAVLARLADGRQAVACHGMTSLENPLPVDGSTLFQVGSISKTFTSTASARLAADGSLDLDAPVRRYLPEFAVADATVSAAVTARKPLVWVSSILPAAKLRPLLAAAALVALAACGSSPAVSTTPAPTPSPTPLPGSVATTQPLGASTPVDAVQALIATGGPTICRPSQGEMWSQGAGCPVTPRLQQRLQSGPSSGSAGGADPVCRCQNIAPALVTLMSVNGGSATVRAQFQFAKPLDIQFSVVQQAQGSGWLVDDSSCGDPSTSIYLTPVKPCG